MNNCIIGREVILRLRRRRTGTSKNYSVVCPANWKKGRLLDYVRREHPEESVVIVDWNYYTHLWIVNPAEMLTDPRGPAEL